MGTHPIFESDFDCLTDESFGLGFVVMSSVTMWDPFELCKLDDLCTGLILDPKLEFATHKMDVTLNEPNKAHWPRIKSILNDFQLFACALGPTQYSQTIKRLRDEVPWASMWPCQNETDEMKQRVNEHIQLYLKMWDPSSGYSIKACDRYSRDGVDGRGGTLIATCPYRRGETIKELKGCIAVMTADQQRQILHEGVNDYSVQYSTNKRQSQLWLGPASFLNHDCKPNAKIESTGPHTASVKAITEIRENEEILIFYGKEFFGTDNCDCECRTCERRKMGKFRTEDDTRKDTISPLKTPAGQKYGLRETASRKRRVEREREEENHQNDDEEEHQNMTTSEQTDIQIKTEKRRIGRRTMEQTTQVTLRQKRTMVSSDTSDSDQPREIRLKYRDGSIIIKKEKPHSSSDTLGGGSKRKKM